MKAKTSITLSEATLCDVDRAAGGEMSRSAFIERVLKAHFRKLRRDERDAHDIAIYNRLADDPNFESDAWEFGVDPMELGDPVEILAPEAAAREAG
jgi:metal-responsive CopG/Arc/MetJ family transcriptional regulator